MFMKGKLKPDFSKVIVSLTVISSFWLLYVLTHGFFITKVCDIESGDYPGNFESYDYPEKAIMIGRFVLSVCPVSSEHIFTIGLARILIAIGITILLYIITSSSIEFTNKRGRKRAASKK